MYLKEVFHLDKKEKPNTIIKAIEDLIKKVRMGKDLKIIIEIGDDVITNFYATGGTESDSNFW